MPLDLDTLSAIIKRTPIPLVADDVITEYIRFKNMGYFDRPEGGGSGVEEVDTSPLPLPTDSKIASQQFKNPIFGPNSSVWERMMIGQLIGAVPGAIAGHYAYPDDPEAQSALAGAVSSASALGGILAPNIQEWLGMNKASRPIGFADPKTIEKVKSVMPKIIPKHWV